MSRIWSNRTGVACYNEVEGLCKNYETKNGGFTGVKKVSYKKGSDDDLFDFERKNVEGGDVSLCPGKRKNFFCLKIVEKVLTFFMMIFPIRPGGKKLKKFLIYFKHRLEEKIVHLELL